MLQEIGHRAELNLVSSRTGLFFRRPATPAAVSSLNANLCRGVFVNLCRKFLILGLVLALMFGVSCSSGESPFENQAGNVPVGDGGAVTPDTAGTVPHDSSGAVPPDTADTLPPDSSDALPTDTVGTVPADTTSAGPTWESQLLACEPQRHDVAVAIIGPAGGQIVVGNHKLTVMPLALSQEVAIRMEQVDGTVNSVRLSPEGLQFAVPSILSLSYKNCPNIRHPKRIVYIDESLSILEILPSLDFNNASQVKGLINHFSRYAVAY